MTELSKIRKNGIDYDIKDSVARAAIEELEQKGSINVPETLPNPHTLTFTGAVEATYDGSEAVSVEIPVGFYPVVDMTETSAALQPNTYYRWGQVASLNITLVEKNDGVANEYCFEFVSGEAATVLTVPDTIKWVSEPSIEPEKTYQVSILSGIGVIVGA